MECTLKLAVISVLLLLISAVKVQSSNDTLPVRINAVVIAGAPIVPRSCPSADILESARSNLSAAIQQSLSVCGGPGWRPVADLDMADPSQSCPSPWAEKLAPARSCKRSASAATSAGCEGVSFTVSGGTYSNVCGRALGYASVTPDAFADLFGRRNGSIDNPYVDGVSVTYGSPRQHIWTFGAGHGGAFRCPCDTSNRARAPLPPSFVGDNYFCDGEYNGALWDAMDCTTACCTFNSPPYFTVTLPAPTSDNIEVRICLDEHTSNEPVSLAELQLFVQ